MGVVMREARGKDGEGEGERNGEESKEGEGDGGGKTDVRIPERVVREGVRIVRGVLEEVVDVVVEE